MRQQKFLSARWLAFALAVLLVSVLTLGAVLADLPDDGRINVVTHFGGDALYCVDANGNPTNNYGDFAGFRLLSMNGSVLWEVSSDTVAQALSTPDQSALIAQGSGSYGTASIWGVAPSGGDPVFTFFGVDEWGKPNSMTFTGCTPVGPATDEGGAASGGGGGGTNETPEASAS